MNKVTELLVKKFGHTSLLLKKNSPEILVVAGAVGVVASVVMACKATLKVDQITAEANEKLDEINECREKVDEQTYSEEDMKKDKMIVCVRTIGKLAKVYGPAAITLTASLMMIFKAHGILRARNAALGAAYAAIDAAFKKYRERAIERFGEEVDKELRYGLKKEEITTIDEDGKEKKEIVTTADISEEYSAYARIFDEGSRHWTKSAEYNYMFLREAEKYFNDLLAAKGHLFLNEVYDYLDIPRTSAGQVVGWLKDGDGDGRVDIGLFSKDDPQHRAFINGSERNIWLDFNVDGVIYDKIEEICMRER